MQQPQTPTPLRVVPPDSPQAGPSRPRALALDPLPELLLDEQDEDADRELFLRRQKEYTDLEDSVEASAQLLDSLASYLNSFQDDLSEVSGQIADLQARSDDIERQLKGRRVVLPPLNALLTDLILPPSLVLTIRDTEPSANPQLWLQAIAELEEKMVAVKSRGGKVKAARELDSVVEALALKAFHQLPPFLLSLIRPLRSASKGLSTNLAVMQTSLLLKYQPFYAFLLRYSPRQAKQVERGYVNAARAYYETGMRRYARALTTIRARTPEKPDLVGVVSNEDAAVSLDKTPPSIRQLYDRLQYADLNAEGDTGPVILAYMVDDKELTVPVEALFRSLGLVLLDNASAEFTFIVRFFARAAGMASPAPSRGDRVRSQEPSPITSPVLHPAAASDAGRSRTRRTGSSPLPGEAESLKDAERIWHEVFDSALEYCTTFFTGLLSPTPPSSVPLLTIIRLNDHLLTSAESRGTLPLVPYLTGWKMQLWPTYRKVVDGHVDSVKKLADYAEGKGLAGFMSSGVKDAVVRIVAVRYAALFSCVVALADAAEDAMLFTSMNRLRSELIRLATTNANKIKDAAQRPAFLSGVYDLVVRELVSGPAPPAHPRLQTEVAFFKAREEEARVGRTGTGPRA